MSEIAVQVMLLLAFGILDVHIPTNETVYTSRQGVHLYTS